MYTFNKRSDRLSHKKTTQTHIFDKTTNNGSSFCREKVQQRKTNKKSYSEDNKEKNNMSLCFRGHF